MLPASMLLATGLYMLCYGNVSSMRYIYGKSFDNTRQHIFFKLMPENQGHSGRLTVYVQTGDPKMCSQTKFGIPRIYARDTIFLDLMAVVKVRDAP